MGVRTFWNDLKESYPFLCFSRESNESTEEDFVIEEEKVNLNESS